MKKELTVKREKRAEKKPKGIKHDGGKVDYYLIPAKVEEMIAQVLTDGAEKYEVNNWKHVRDGKRRFYSAAIRHLNSWREGNIIDEESGRPHLAHAITNLIFLLQRDNEGIDL